MLEVTFDNFTLINLGYALLTFIALVYYIQYTLHCRSFSKMYPIWPNLSADFYDKADEERLLIIKEFMLDFETLIAELHDYETVITLSIFCAILKLFEYFNKSKSMNALINVI